MTTLCRAEWACRFPPRLRRWRWVFALEAGIGQARHIIAKLASQRRRWGFSAAAPLSSPALATPTPSRRSRWGASSSTSGAMSRSSSAMSAPLVYDRRRDGRRTIPRSDTTVKGRLGPGSHQVTSRSRSAPRPVALGWPTCPGNDISVNQMRVKPPGDDRPCKRRCVCLCAGQVTPGTGAGLPQRLCGHHGHGEHTVEGGCLRAGLDGRRFYLVGKAGQRNGPDLLVGDQLDRKTAGRVAIHDRLQLVPGAFQKFKLPRPAGFFLCGLDKPCRLDELPVGTEFVGSLVWERSASKARTTPEEVSAPNLARVIMRLPLRSSLAACLLG